ncbi:MAG: NAD(P)H dehydrogenase, partial [Variovorax sp.]|nr:NAD(P)H dehydrogenase [Variovorax sp.]
GVLCGMRFLPPLILHGARSASDDEVQSHVQTFSERLGSFPNWPEIDALGDCPTCVVPPTDRPQEDEDAAAMSREFGKALSNVPAAMSGTAESA